MNSNAIMDVPELVSREDPIGLSLAAGRVVLRTGKRSASQREKLAEFFKNFETALENGLEREQAAAKAKAATGL